MERYEAAFSHLSQRENGGLDPARAADLLRWIGTVHRQRGDADRADEAYEASLSIAEANGLDDHIASALNCQAIVAQFRGQVESAEALYVRARTLAEQLGDERLAAMIDQNLGTLANIHGDLDKAVARYRSALERYRRLGDDLAAAWALNNLGMAHVDQGVWSEAETCFDQAFQLADGLHDTGTLASVELNRAELYVGRKQFERARGCCDRAFELFSRLQSRSGLGETHKFYGVLYRATTKPNLAEANLKLAVELARECQDILLEAESERERALVHLGEERNRDALQCLNRAHAIFQSIEARREIADLDKRLDRLEETYLQVTKAWGESIESKDRYTAGHCQRVADYTCMLAEAIGIAGRDLTWIRMGGFLHDVGKTAVSAEVLNKPAKLTPEEWQEMKAHTTAGDEIVAPLNFPYDIRPLVRSHHERFDGNGYPDGLKGEDIPLMARVLCVADIYDALTTTRSYRPALSMEEALGIMERDAGKIVDPVLFPIFKRLITGSQSRADETLAQPVASNYISA